MDQIKIWEYFQNNSEVADVAFNAESRYRFLSRQVRAGSAVLNIGVGKGGLEEILVEKQANVHCLDPNEKSIQDIRAKLGLGEKAQVGFSQSMPFDDETFDFVVISEVLEHLTDKVLEETIEECHRVLRSGGKLIGTVPAEERLLDSQVVCPDCGKTFHRWGHVQEFSEIKLKNLLMREFSDYGISRKYFGNWNTLNWKGKLSCLLKVVSLKLGLAGSGETFYFSVSK